MGEFKPEIYKQKQDNKYDAPTLAALERLKAKAEQVSARGTLFQSSEQKEFEVWKQMFPEEYAILENDQAFRELLPSEQWQVSFDYLKKHGENTAQAIRLRER